MGARFRPRVWGQPKALQTPNSYKTLTYIRWFPGVLETKLNRTP